MNAGEILDLGNAEVTTHQQATVFDDKGQPKGGGEPRWTYQVRNKFTKAPILEGECAGTKLDAIDAAAQATQEKLNLELPKTREQELEERLAALEGKDAKPAPAKPKPAPKK